LSRAQDEGADHRPVETMKTSKTAAIMATATKMTASTGLFALTFASPSALHEAAIPCRLFHLP